MPLPLGFGQNQDQYDQSYGFSQTQVMDIIRIQIIAIYQNKDMVVREIKDTVTEKIRDMDKIKDLVIMEGITAIIDIMVFD